MALVRLGGVLCLAAFLFGSVCMTIVATMGEGEDPPKIFEQMGGAACAIFALGMIMSLVGWLISLNQPEPPKPTAAGTKALQDLEDEQSDEDDPDGDDAIDQGNTKKPDPYASEHRRREN